MRKTLKLVLLTLVFLAGLCAVLYPHINGRRLQANAASAVVKFEQAVSQPTLEVPTQPTPTPYEDLLIAMQKYNLTLFETGQSELTDPWSYEAKSFSLDSYGVADDVFGVLSIPKLELELPIYLGATYDNMAAGAAHMTETSLPIGGDNTNCVIAGHRGWDGASYFLHIDELAVGDEVTVKNLWGSLLYKVSEIKIIEPYEVDKILIQDGRELLTLMTCHPPNTGGRFRYLVICERDE